MSNNPVAWFEIYVQDMARAKQFYESVFKVKLEKLNSPGLEMWGFPMAMDRLGAWVRWSGWMAFLRAATAPWSTSVARTAPSRPPVPPNSAGGCDARRCRSANTASSPWSSTPKAT